MKDIFENSFVIMESQTLGDAMRVITNNQRGAVVVVAEDGLFRGVASDGDIRRAMVKGAILLTPIYKVINPNASVVKKGPNTSEKAEKIFETRADIHLIPVTDENNVFVDVIIRNPGERKVL